MCALLKRRGLPPLPPIDFELASWVCARAAIIAPGQCYIVRQYRRSGIIRLLKPDGSSLYKAEPLKIDWEEQARVLTALKKREEVMEEMMSVPSPVDAESRERFLNVLAKADRIFEEYPVDVEK